MTVYDIEDLYSHLGVFGNFQVFYSSSPLSNLSRSNSRILDVTSSYLQIFVVVMYTIGERVTAGLLDFQVNHS